jgi:hypothetical protein
MRVFNVVLIGAVLGALDGVGIFFEPKEPYKWQILGAATLKGILAALLTAFSLSVTMRWWAAAGIGMFYGLAMSLVVYLAKGGPKSGDAPYVIPSGIITGGS